MDRPLRGWITALLLLLAAGATYAIPSLGRFRPIRREALARIFLDPFRGRPRTPLLAPPLPVEEPEPAEEAPEASLASGDEAEPRPDAPVVQRRVTAPPGVTQPEAGLPEGILEAPPGALAAFQQALGRAEAGQGVARVTHFGDSPITGDLISGEARARLHRLYGNGGHGWILAGRPWEWYGHRGITLEARGWKVNAPALTARRDRIYGLGGATFTASGDALTRITMAKGVSGARAELHFLARPEGGSVEVQVDENEPTLVETRGEGGPARHVFRLGGDRPHRITLRPLGDGEVTLFGIVLERDAPGIVYDAIGANGGAIQHLARMDGEPWVQALRLRRPDLVILGFGTNECGYYNIPGPGYVHDYKEVVRRIRRALPKASILIMAPMDRGQRNAEGEIETMPALVRIVEAQRQIARELGCAFFDTFRAMGGAGTAGRWYVGSPRLMTGDLTHPTHPGADRVARLLVEALQREVVASAADLADLQQDRPVAETRPEGGEHDPGARPR